MNTPGSLACRETGAPEARPLVLLHGLTSDGSVWDEVAAHFGDRHRALVPDLRGHGRSPHPGTYSFELMRDDVLVFLDELALPEGTLIGHSLGGVVAYLPAARHPDRVARLVLAETPPPVPLNRPLPPRPSEPPGYHWAARAAIVRQLNAPDPALREALGTIRPRPSSSRAGPKAGCPRARSPRWPPAFPTAVSSRSTPAIASTRYARAISARWSRSSSPTELKRAAG